MNQRDNILQELSELDSSLVNSQPHNIYSVPTGYFENLATEVLNRIRAMAAANASDELACLSPLLHGLSKKMPFELPAGYFEELEKNILVPVRESKDYQTAKEEIEALSPLLGGLKKEMPFTVPAGYFESLGPVVPATAPAKVFSLTHRKWFRYAAAAMITGIIVLAGFLVFDKGAREPGGKALAKFTKDVKKMNETQKEDLIDFIDAGLTGKESAKVNTDNKTKEVQELLQGIPEEELKDFEEQSEDLQGVLMTN